LLNISSNSLYVISINFCNVQTTIQRTEKVNLISFARRATGK